MSHTFKPGDTVKVKQTAGFSRGSAGVVVQRPSEFDKSEAPENAVFVLRDGAGTPVFFYPTELERYAPPPVYTDTDRLDWVIRVYGLAHLKDRSIIDAVMTQSAEIAARAKKVAE